MSKTELHPIGELPRERAIMVAVVPKGSDQNVVSEHLDELELLLDTAGADVELRLYQERARPDVSTALGKGKVEELAGLVEESGVQLVVFDDELTPTQLKNLEEALKVKVLDRTGVILDIFAARAQSKEARTQVELAQLEYLLPRLSRMWTHLSKQYGGVGTKGPGETQIETDRRMYRGRMQRLREKLAEIDTQRAVQRKGRQSLPRFALVGYTNAGKSTLLRCITQTDAYVEDRLFATLDTTVRGFELPSGQRALLSDTVGFIRKLPTQLVASFRSTLAETLEADVLVHVVDISHEQFREHINVVEQTLLDLGVTDTPLLLVFNKVDRVDNPLLLADTEAEYPGCLFISAERGINITRLLQAMQEAIEDLSAIHTVIVPYAHSKVVSTIYERADVLDRSDDELGTILTVKVPSNKLPAFQRDFAPFIGSHGTPRGVEHP
jgi:GTP-binding protein HflX